MKIALITIWHEKNFGAEMQCYATVKALKELGHEVSVIDFRLSDHSDMSFKSKISLWLSHHSPETRNFEEFWCKYIPATIHYNSHELLQKVPPEADLYLAGSDQIWNPDITKEKWHTYFLDFGDSKTRRASYASSFGEDYWKWDSLKSEASKMLERFDNLSVREYSGSNLLSRQFGLNSKTVLDPTLLHEGYPELVSDLNERATLVYYPLTNNHELERFAQETATSLNLEYVNTNRKTYLVRSIVWKRTPIEQWIRNIAESKLVITPSFHGLAFSLIYQRQFIIIQNSKGRNRSSRITDLLDKLGLRDRYFTSIEDACRSRIWEKPIEYSSVNKILNQLRDESWSYLKETVNS